MTQLICFPFAGGGTAFFRPWQRMLGDSVEVQPILLPGRERRLLEPPCVTVEAAIDDTLSQLSGKLREAASVIVFGHSLGAALAYALTTRLAGQAGVRTTRLVVSGSPAPHKARPERASGLDDDAFLARVSEFAGFDDPAMLDGEVRELILPALRADVAMHESYSPDPQRIDAVITAIRGRDDGLVTQDDLLGWQEVAHQAIEFVTFPGGHMYLSEQSMPLIEKLAAYVR